MDALHAKLTDDKAAGGTMEADLNRLTQFLHGEGVDTGLGFNLPTLDRSGGYLTGTSKEDALAAGAAKMGVTPVVAGKLVKIYQQLLVRRKNHPKYKTSQQTASPQP